MRADVLSHLDYFHAQPPVCEPPRCVGETCEWTDCRVHAALVEINDRACAVSAQIKSMRHVTKPARRCIAEYTADGFGEAAAEYGADFDTKAFTRHCGVSPREPQAVRHE